VRNLRYLIRKLQYLIASKNNIIKEIKVKEEEKRKRNIESKNKTGNENIQEDFDINNYHEYMYNIEFELDYNHLITDNKDLIIYYFYQDETEETSSQTKIKQIKINEDGSLTNSFGPGFFDESVNLKIELLKIKNQSKN